MVKVKVMNTFLNSEIKTDKCKFRVYNLYGLKMTFSRTTKMVRVKKKTS
jgi:hypothetical protein